MTHVYKPIYRSVRPQVKGSISKKISKTKEIKFLCPSRVRKMLPIVMKTKTRQRMKGAAARIIAPICKKGSHNNIPHIKTWYLGEDGNPLDHIQKWI